MKWSLLLLLLILPSLALAERFTLFNYNWPAPNPVASAISPQATQVEAGIVRASAVPLTLYDVPINPCAVSGTIVYGHFDDKGEVFITSAQGSASVLLQDNGGTGPEGRVPGSNDKGRINPGPFDPRTAVVSWKIENSGGGQSKIEAVIDITYASTQNATWDGTTCTPIEISNMRASTLSPEKNANVTIWCESSTSSSTIGIATNISAAVTPLGWTGAEAAYTFNVGDASAINVSCTVDGSAMQSLTIIPGSAQLAVNGLVAVPECTSPPVVNLAWNRAASAVSYRVYVGDELNATVTGLNASIRNLRNGTSYVFSVAAVSGSGQEGPRARVTRDALCALAARDIYLPPPRFQRAFFARKGGREVTAYWDENRAVFVYKNFDFDFSKAKPQDAQYARIQDNRQALVLEESQATTFWRPYTSGLRIA